MSAVNNPSATGGGGSREKTYFKQQREALMGEISMSFEQVLANINRLNRSLEAVIEVGNEFSAVEALWSQFENVMGKDPDEGRARGEDEADQTQHEQGPSQGPSRGPPREPRE